MWGSLRLAPIIIHFWPSYMAKLLIAIREKSMVVHGGNAHAIRPGYTNVDANPPSVGHKSTGVAGNNK